MNIKNRTLLEEFSKDDLIDYIEQLHSNIEELASRMTFKPVTSLDDIKEGSYIMITGDSLKSQIMKVQMIKVSDNDGVEVILDKKINSFFNLGMYLQGKSWAKDVRVLI